MKIALVGDRSFKTLLKKNNKLNIYEFTFLDELSFNILMEKSFDALIGVNYFKNIPGGIIEYFEGKVFAIYITLDVKTVYLKVYHVTNEILYKGHIIYERNIDKNKPDEIIKAMIDAIGYIRDNLEKFKYYKNSKFITINDNKINYKYKFRELLTLNFDFGKLKFLNVINLNREELELIRNWRNKDEIRKWMYTDHIITMEEHFNWVYRLRTNNNAVYFLVKYNNDPVGVIGLSNIDIDNKSASVGIYIGNEKFKGKGFGKVMIYILLKFSFDVLNLNRVQVEVFSDNIAAIHLYSKFFQKEGTLRKFKFKNGVFKDVIIMSILKEEWLSKKDKWRDLYENTLYRNKWEKNRS